MKRQSKLLAVLLCLCMVTALFPTWTALAGGNAQTVVYINGISGNDNKTGVNAANAVKTVDKAAELAGPDGLIAVCGQVTYIDKGAVDLSNLTFVRADGYKAALLYLHGNTVMTLRNVTLDGKNLPTNAWNCSLISIGGGATLQIEAGTKLINNTYSAIYCGGGTVNMNGGTIQDNASSAEGGGIYFYDGTANLTGGTIQNNSTQVYGGGVCITGQSAVLLDGTQILNNQAPYNGGGVYIEGASNPASFVMKSGSITGNTLSEEYGSGAGIYAWYAGKETLVSITGGTIQNNTGPACNGQAVSLARQDASAGYARLQFSGIPQISGDVYLWDELTDGPVIEVTGAFSPANAVALSANCACNGVAAVSYAPGQTPNLSYFVSANPTSEGLVKKGQTLAWAEVYKVLFKESLYGTTYDTKYAVNGSMLDPTAVPQPTKAGYRLAGWTSYRSQTLWNFESDPITQQDTFLPAWELNAPTVTLAADNTVVRCGQSITLTATPTHDLGAGVAYTYAWYLNGNLLNNQTASVLSATQGGSYSVQVTAQTGSQTSPAAQSNVVNCYVEHSPSNQWQSDPFSHWHACACGYEADKAGHTADGGRVTAAATAEKPGVKTYCCTVCGRVLKTEVIQPTGNPQTGDAGKALGWCVLPLLSSLAIGEWLFHNRKKKLR